MTTATIPAGMDMKAVEAQTATELAKLLAQERRDKPPIPIKDGKYVPETFEQNYRLAAWLYDTGLAPKGFGNAGQVMVAISMGAAVGLDPMSSVRAIAVVNGRPSIWGDAMVALIQGSGVLEWQKTEWAGEGETLTCRVTMKRKGQVEPYVGEFSWADAKKAGLASKDTYRQYGKRMLLNRARSYAGRDGFADLLNGLSVAEESMDAPDVSAKPVDPLRPATAQADAIPELPDPTPESPTKPPEASGPGPSTSPDYPPPDAPKADDGFLGSLGDFAKPDPVPEPTNRPGKARK